MNLIADKEFKMVRRYIQHKTCVSVQYHCLGSEMRILDIQDSPQALTFDCMRCLFFKLDYHIKIVIEISTT